MAEATTPGISALRPFVDSAFRGTPKFAWSWLAALRALYPESLCMPRACRPSHHAMWVTEDYSAVRTADGVLEDAMDKCDGIPYSAWVLVFRARHGEIHGNALVYDRRRNRVIRFEPRGAKVGYEWRALDALLADFARTKLGGAVYMAPTEYQAKIGPQRLEVVEAGGDRTLLPAHGPCVIWSLMFIAIMLEFPDMEPAQVASRLENLDVSPRVYAQAMGHFIAATMQDLPRCK